MKRYKVTRLERMRKEIIVMSEVYKRGERICVGGIVELVESIELDLSFFRGYSVV